MGNACTDGNTQNVPVEKVQIEAQMEGPNPVMPEEPPEEEPQLLITIVGARGVRDSAWLPSTGKPDCYCEVKTGDLLLHTTNSIVACDPFWGEVCKIKEIASGSPLSFTVYGKDLLGSDRLGRVLLEAKDYASAGYNGELKLKETQVSQAYIRLRVKVAGKPLPPGPPAMINVSVEKPSKEVSFGLDLDCQQSALLCVMEVKNDGAVDLYNRSLPPDMQIQPGDAIESVNGECSSTEKMLAQFRTAMKADCVIKRTVLVNIIFDRGSPSSTPLGLQFQGEEVQGENLIVKQITGGAAEKHNNSAQPHEKLHPNDRILSVGDKSRSAVDMQKKLESTEGKLRVLVRRVAEQPDAKDIKGGLTHWLFG